VNRLVRVPERYKISCSAETLLSQERLFYFIVLVNWPIAHSLALSFVLPRHNSRLELNYIK
jgi:hypothetical protein